MQHRDVADRGRLIICRVRPGIGSVGLGVAMQLKNFYNPVPDGLTVESLCDWNAFEVAGFHAVQLVDYVLEFLDVTHLAASTKSPTVQKVGTTPAAMAGVQRSV